MSEQQVKLVYVVQQRKWKLHVQWGRVNKAGTFFIVEHSIMEMYTNYFDACIAMTKYYLDNSPAKPVCDNLSSENNKTAPYTMYEHGD